MSETQQIQELFRTLCRQRKTRFPKPGQPLDAPSAPGVYIIRWRETVLHVGRTYRGKNGLRQRLGNHLHGASSFTNNHLNGDGAKLRNRGYTYQCLQVGNARLRALLEAYAAGKLCPKYMALGDKTAE